MPFVAMREDRVMQLEIESLSKIAKQLQNENDRSITIIAASLLDLQLEQLLRNRMLDRKEVANFFQGYSPLASLSAKASLALFLGLIPTDIFNDLTCVRKIRNSFAHTFEELAFDKSPVSDFVSNLVSVKWFLESLPLANKPIKKEEVEQIRTVPRKAFEIAVAILVLYLDFYKRSAQKVRSEKAAFPFPIVS